MVDFLDLRRQHASLRDNLSAAWERILERGSFILGEEVRLFEEEFASFLGIGHAVGVASGTDAITLSLIALGIGPGDEVVVPAFTAPPTVVAICRSGARPVLADIDEETFCLDPAEAERVIGPRTRALLPVHLYGNPAPLSELSLLCQDRGIILVEDACQAHGAELEGKALGSWGACGCFSFYPTKNLGALGDGGMVVTADADLAARLRSLRDYGRSGGQRLEEVGLNSRLDELQAALLREKLPLLVGWNRRREELDRRYRQRLEGLSLQMPKPPSPSRPSCHIFSIFTPRREELAAFLAGRGIGTAIHYPLPIHLHAAFSFLGHRPGDFPRAEKAAAEELSLPLYPELEDEEADEVVSALLDFLG